MNKETLQTDLYLILTDTLTQNIVFKTILFLRDSLTCMLKETLQNTFEPKLEGITFRNVHALVNNE